MKSIDAEQGHRICEFSKRIDRLSQLHQQPTEEMRDLLHYDNIQSQSKALGFTKLKV